MPAEALAAMKDQVGEKIDKMQESIITQAGVSYVRAEYEAMGEDVDAIQMDYMKSTGISMVLMAFVTMMLQYVWYFFHPELRHLSDMTSEGWFITKS